MSETTLSQPLKLDELQGEQAVFSKTVGEFDVYQFAGVTGDFAPFHVDADLMSKSAYGQRIAHGVLILGYLATASAVYWRVPGREGVGVSLGYDNVRFIKPVFLGDTITATYQVTGWDEEKRRFLAEGRVTNQHGELVLAATHLTKAFAVEG
ncbi:MaoC/PaaZ C-terminal domain-containing protein [Arthrobacter sp. S2(2024)]|uniref:MaoC/PaaZ C-terminal domain-containing protein n=1 Tax=Arthrobacter sp. S2(2024) TaxID=3111911 RepID=UPI002FC5CAA7